MNKKQIFFIFILLVTVVLVYRSLQDVEEKSTLEAISENTSNSAISSMPAALQNPQTNKEFSEIIHKESESMSRLSNQPEEVQKRLKDLAQKVQEPQVAVLEENALNTNLNGDERFLSVYILGESSLKKAQESLEVIATAPIPALKDSRMITQEEIIRGQAIESLKEPESLKRILSRADNKFLVDRAQRTLMFREKKVKDSPESQDQKALEKVLEKSTQ